jgi:hypothetical protein
VGALGGGAGADPLHAWGLAHRRELPVVDLTVAIAPPEYVIARKLRYARAGGGDRHLRDVHRMLERAIVPIDRDVIAAFADDLGVRLLWERVPEWSEPR